MLVHTDFEMTRGFETQPPDGRRGCLEAGAFCEVGYSMCESCSESERSKGKMDEKRLLTWDEIQL